MPAARRRPPAPCAAPRLSENPPAGPSPQAGHADRLGGCPPRRAPPASGDRRPRPARSGSTPRPVARPRAQTRRAGPRRRSPRRRSEPRSARAEDPTTRGVDRRLP
ncbi:hypothetical protein IP69_17015 [Bosea sp. AAP35]|nr:hypothetical protein IP69_17015 [Bosea sp. AAP35]